MADLFKILLAEKLGHCDSLYESVIGKKLGGYSWLSDYETAPYLYRAMPNLSHYYNREIMEEVVGGSVGWNQLVQNGNFADGTTGWYATRGTLSVSDGLATVACTENGNVTIGNARLGIPQGHKYFTFSKTKSASGRTPYISGIARNFEGSPSSNWQTLYFIDNAISYSAGYPKFGYKSMEAGETFNIDYVSITDLTLALGSTIADYVYSLEQATAGSGVAWLKEHFPKMFGQYNPYDAGSIQSVSGLVSHITKDSDDNVLGSYPLDSTLTLRGIPKLDNGKLYYDGDTYGADGTVNRKYGIRPYQNGDESLADAVTDGTNTVYKLATPTTETAQPFTKTQLCDSGGTEEFITSGIVSVGHKSKYAEK